MAGFWNKVLKLQDNTRPFCTVIVPAAGTSSRMGGENKLMMELCGVPVLVRTLQAIDAAELVNEIIVATREESMLEVGDLCSRAGLHKSIKVVLGGESRAESVLAAAMEASPKAKLLAVHDGARPLVLPTDIDHVIRYACNTYAAAPAIPVTDTIKVADAAGLVDHTPERRTLYAVQTPQVFRAELLKAALQSAVAEGAEITDDCSAVERMGKKVWLTEGSRENMKITTPIDLVIAEAILKERGCDG